MIQTSLSVILRTEKEEEIYLHQVCSAGAVLKLAGKGLCRVAEQTRFLNSVYFERKERMVKA